MMVYLNSGTVAWVDHGLSSGKPITMGIRN